MEMDVQNLKSITCQPKTRQYPAVSNGLNRDWFHRRARINLLARYYQMKKAPILPSLSILTSIMTLLSGMAPRMAQCMALTLACSASVYPGIKLLLPIEENFRYVFRLCDRNRKRDGPLSTQNSQCIPLFVRVF